MVLAGLFHETHTFLDGLTTWDAFDVREGVELLQARGDASPLGGILEFAQQQNWGVIPTIMATAVPSATVHDEVLERYWERWIDHARDPIAAGVDAIFLVLHGAFVSESYRDVEGELLRRIREMPGASALPIFGVYDQPGPTAWSRIAKIRIGTRATQRCGLVPFCNDSF
jgi:microcystin degradation protein MlrC